MNSRERVLLALNHKEPDRIPLDVGGTGMTGLHITAYENLRAYLGLPPVTIRLNDTIQLLAEIDRDVLDRLGTDFLNVAPRSSAQYALAYRDEGDYMGYTDEWGIDWRKPKEGGFYYDMHRHPLTAAQTVADTQSYVWPDATDPHRFAGLRQRAQAAQAEGKAVVLGGLCAGVTEMHAWLRGYETYYTDFAYNPALAEHIMDRVTDLKIAYWQRAFEEAGDYVDVCMEADDMAGQERLLLSPATYRKFIKPRHARLFQFIKEHSHAKIFFHSCGAIRPLLADLIDAGIDILNPVQKSAKGMDLAELKREFGRDLTFWGGGIDTQRVFGTGTPEQVRADVKSNIEALAPGGGFVFGTIHNTQANVPPENFMAMWEAYQQYSQY
jgi:uroporphyrinogen decarboxylase